MKTLITVLLFVGFTLEVTAQTPTDIDQFEVKVDGLGCPFCAYGLEKKFKQLKGIKKIAINIETGDFSFTYPTEKKLSLKQVETQVEKAGYSPVSIKVVRATNETEYFSKEAKNNIP